MCFKMSSHDVKLNEPEANDSAASKFPLDMSMMQRWVATQPLNQARSTSQEVESASEDSIQQNGKSEETGSTRVNTKLGHGLVEGL